MGRTLHKKQLIKEFGYTDRMNHVTDLEELEWQMKEYVRQNDIYVPSGKGDYLTNDLASSTAYTLDILKENPQLFRQIDAAIKKNQARAGMEPVGLGIQKGRRKSGATAARNVGSQRSNRGNGGSNWEDQGYWKGMATFYGDKMRGNGRSGRSHRQSRSLKEILFSPLGVVLAVLALCVFLYKVVGPAMYSFIMNGPFFKILLIILAGAAVVAVLKSARGWPSGVKFAVILIIALVLLYSVVGPAIYSFLMSGALFRIICLVIGVAASIGILKGNLGWPIGIKLAVIVVIWVVLKDQVL